VAYVPDGRVVGFGLLARLVDCFAHRLVIQEVLARQVADALVEHLGARGAACVLDAEQMCLTVRGERRREARAHAQAFAGTMARSAAWQQRVLAISAGEPRPGGRRKRR
jgi:GTP cyclohydrolase I